MSKDIETLTAEVTALREEIAQLKSRTVLVLEDGRDRERFTREAIVDMAKAILSLGQSTLSSEEYARIKKIAGV
jgi:cell division protein FtsB